MIALGLILLAFQTPLAPATVRGNNASVSENGQGYSVDFHAAEWPILLLTPKSPWDWSGTRALQFDAFNPGTRPVSLGVRFDDDASADGWHHSRTGNAVIPAGKTQRVFVVFGPDPQSVGMRGLPPMPGGLNAPAGGEGKFDAGHIVSLQFFLHNATSDTKLELSKIGLSAGRDVDLNGIVDRFGQYTGADWPGKAHTEADLKLQRATEEAAIGKSPASAGRDRFGGTTEGPLRPATGFFRTEKVGGKWWLVDPVGHLFFSYGIDTIQPDESSFIARREKMFVELPAKGDPLAKFYHQVAPSGLAYNFYGANLYRKYGDGYERAWRESVLQRLPAWGFNTIGNWSDYGFIRNGRVPYVATATIEGSHVRLASGSDYWSKMHDPFDPKFQTDVTASLRNTVAFVKDDPWCLGYFVDNELSWAGDGPEGRFGLALGALSAEAGSPAKGAFVEQLKKKYGEVGQLNLTWGTHFVSWDDLKSPVKLTLPLNDDERKDCSEFVYTLASRYFSIIHAELKRADPNHLYLGCRFAWHGIEAERAAAESCDVVSYNIYAPRVDPVQWAHLSELNKPCIIGEFHFGSLDRGMFHPGLVATANQSARAEMYIDYVTSVLKNPAFVGCHWFQYADEPLVGRTWDGENYNIGMVSVTDAPYPELTSAAKKIQSEGYRIRLSK